MKTEHSFLKIVVGLLLIAGAIYFIVRGQGGSDIQSSKLDVVASFYPLYFFAAEIGGNQAEVTNITPPGGEPHDYDLTAQDIAKITKSDILVLNGGMLEPWADNMLQNIDADKTRVVIAGEGLTTGRMEEDGEDITDPHVWLSPPLAQRMVEKIAQAFKQSDPAHADYYSENAEALETKLANLDQEFKAGLAECVNQDIVTAHAAFGYLAAAYGINQIPITGVSPDAEPSPQQLADITKLARERNVKVIFFESLVSPALAETIAHEIGAKTLVLDPLEGLTPADIARGEDYFSVMRQNLANIEEALECQVP